MSTRNDTKIVLNVSGYIYGPVMTEEDRYTRITLRIPKEIHQRLTKSASERSHSMNAEIVQRLEESFDLDKAITTKVMSKEEIRAASIEQARTLAEMTARLIIEDLRKKSN